MLLDPTGSMFLRLLRCSKVCGQKCIYPPLQCGVCFGFFTETLAFVHTEKVEQGNKTCCWNVNLKQWALQLKIRPWNTAIVTFHLFSVMLILNNFLVFWRQKVFILCKWIFQNCREKSPQHMQFSIIEWDMGYQWPNFLAYGSPPTAISQAGRAIPLP